MIFQSSMKKLLRSLVLMMLVFSCSQPTQTEKDLRATINKEVSLETFDLVRRENTFLTLEELRQQYEFLSVVYLQNGCQPCYPKFIEWQQKLDSIGVPDNYTALFVIQGESYEEFMAEVLDISYVEDRFYTIMDSEYQFMSKNKTIPMWIIDGSILIDAENKIKMVGAPWLNEDMTELFYKTVNGGQ